jgi:tetratricopeptide (TPR) repeat protein
LDGGRYAEAEAAIRRALDLDAEHPFYLYLLGLALGRQKRFDEAVRLLERARAVGPAPPHLLGALGEFLVEQARFADAERILSEAVAGDPAFAPARYWRAIALLGLERWAEALDDLRTTCALAPDHARAAALRDQVSASLDSVERRS